MFDLDQASMFLLGLLGTGHCVGMCGPLVLALPARAGRLSAHLLYHTGRVITYTAVGAVLGGIGGLAVGEGGDTLATVAWLQVLFSLLAAVFMLLLGLARLGIFAEPAFLSVASPTRIPGFGRVQRGVLLRQRPSLSLLFGLMLGFLPCGLSYAAFARALPAGGVLEGGLLVLAFGLGTVPGLLLLGTAASAWVRRHQAVSDLLSGMLMVGMAVALTADALLTVPA